MKGHITDKKKKSEKKGAVKRIFLGALLIGIGALILGGCGSSTEETQSEQEKTASAKKEDDKIQIGLTVDSLSSKDGFATETFLWRLPEKWVRT